MNHRFEYIGIWWLPKRQDEQITGVLKYNRETGAELSLYGNFGSPQGIFHDSTQRTEVIHGIASSGENITLYKCYRSSGYFGSSGFPTSSYYANIVFVGVHFAPEKVTFRALEIECTHLNEWANFRAFDIPFSTSRRALIRYKQPKPVVARLKEGLKVTIGARWMGLSHSLYQKQASIQERAYIRIDTRKETPFDEMSDLVSHMQNLLSFAFSDATPHLRIEGLTRYAVQQLLNRTAQRPVQVFTRPLGTASDKNITPHDMLFDLADLRDNIQEFLSNWYGKREKLKPVYDLYFGTLYRPGVYVETRFMNIVQAIESYHRRTSNNQIMGKEQYQAMKKAIVHSVPTQYRKWLMDQLAYGDEPRLYDRLIEIISLSQPTSDMVTENAENFARSITDTRNYNTHFPPRLESKALKGEALYWETFKLKVLLETCLLRELGFVPDQIRERVNRKYGEEIQFANRRIAELRPGASS